MRLQRLEDITSSVLHGGEVTDGLAARLARVPAASLSFAGLDGAGLSRVPAASDGGRVGGGFSEGFRCATELGTGLAWVPASCFALLPGLCESLGLEGFVSLSYSFGLGKGVERKRNYVPWSMVALGASSLVWPRRHA
jgi:hypothetical protein